MRIIASFFILFVTGFALNAQKSNPVEKPVQAQFKGGNAKLDKYIIKNFVIPKAYYNQSKSIDLSIQCRFVVQRNGCIGQVVIQNKKDIPVDLQQEAIRVFTEMSCDLWIPAHIGEKNVNMAFMKPIHVQVDAYTPLPKPKKEKVKKSKKKSKK